MTRSEIKNQIFLSRKAVEALASSLDSLQSSIDHFDYDLTEIGSSQLKAITEHLVAANQYANCLVYAVLTSNPMYFED